ncbi:aspartate phosphatase [Bacillus cereus]|uniref:Aspartate phosphatase n=2 Tax=Bacillus thuringiensis TaxID=1428 RepID=A0A9X6PQV9_BACUK|nr:MULTISPECIES: aspartate phosphatase [Bacillus cereus group]MCH5476474.1 aspartate phosphatase [Bacillus cereus]MCU5666810.1 aspartate phosphatase [Bacillus cereus]MDA1926374.1 aspartate phosphatase [Bacillus cereus]MEC2870667.1 aspartate phosphatase [Bacillus cereus]OTY63673.1 aspartate phosphatase [Bacillus thuringiensis serovar yosoo]
MKKAILLMMMLSTVFTFGLTNVKDVSQQESIEVFMDHGEHI